MWIIYTLLAVVSQMMRNVFSKKLGNNISATAVSFARFFYAIPIVLIGFLAMQHFYGGIEILSSSFFVFAFLAAIFQILANTLLVSLFKEKNFAVAISFIKSEAIFIAILAVVFLTEIPSFWGGVGVFLAFLGLMVSALAKEKISVMRLWKALLTKGAYIGLSSGFFFALAVVCIKKSFVFVDAPNIALLSVFVLLVVLLIQSVFLFAYLFFKKRDDLKSVFITPRTPFLIGSSSGIGSFFWFVAFASAHIVYVKTLGQIEFIFGTLISIFYFKEKISRNEYTGMGLMAVGMVLIGF
jgi:drug/metabolite transporter (DMT)-like permease